MVQFGVSRRGVLVLGSAAAACPMLAPAEELIVHVAFRVTRDVAWTLVSLDGKGPYPFTIDTGANTYVVDPKTAEAAGLKVIGMSTSVTAGGEIKLPVFEVKDLIVAGAIHERNIQVGSFRPQPYVFTKGLIPTGGLAVMMFDFETQQLSVSHRLAAAPAGYERLDGHNDADRIDPRQVIYGYLDDKLIRLLVDTGAATTVSLFPGYVRRNNLWNSYPKFIPGRANTVAKVIGTRLVRAKRLAFGSFNFDAPVISLSDPEGEGADERADGLLGLEFLRRMNFIVDPAHKSLWLKPNKFVNDVYRYDRAGVNISRVENDIRVVSVSPGLPAAKAGLRPGDKVTGWAGEGGYFGLLWALEGAPGDVVRIQIERGGESKVVDVTLEERI